MASGGRDALGMEYHAVVVEFKYKRHLVLPLQMHLTDCPALLIVARYSRWGTRKVLTGIIDIAAPAVLDELRLFLLEGLASLR